jgi:hypothetical protein
MASSTKPDLRNITVCTADCSTPAIAARAMAICTTACTFGDAIFFTDRELSGESFRVVSIPPIKSKTDYSRFILKEMAPHIRTPYVLIVQWDGYIVDPQQWTPEFLQYDYIGARWLHSPDHIKVGNGGFSLRSRKLLDVIAAPGFEFVENEPEDYLICRHNRDYMDASGIKFAPESLAVKFSYEYEDPQVPSFGFHSIANFWRHVDDGEMMALSHMFTPPILKSVACMLLILSYYRQNRMQPWHALYSKLRRHAEPAIIAHTMAQVLAVPSDAVGNVNIWENTLAKMNTQPA